jgi:hypothetical protein
MVEVACFAFHLKSHVLALHNVDGLRPAQIRMLPPPPHDALGEDVFWLLDVLGSCYLKNWVVGVDALDLPLTLLRRKLNIIVI